MKVSIKLGELRTLLVPFHSDLVQRNIKFFFQLCFKPVAFADFNGLLPSTRLASVLLTQQWRKGNDGKGIKRGGRESGEGW